MPLHELYTIGHSNRTFEEFVGLIRAHLIKQVLDLRTIPRSRHNPQFNRDILSRSLRNRGIGYRHMKKLGGLRHAKADSRNLGWQNLSFRGFADYMQTDDFAEALKKLTAIASKKRTAVMCAEAVPWRCHRSLIADALTKAKWKVFHIMSRKTAALHRPTPFLRVHKGKMVYPPSVEISQSK